MKLPSLAAVLVANGALIAASSSGVMELLGGSAGVSLGPGFSHGAAELAVTERAPGPEALPAESTLVNGPVPPEGQQSYVIPVPQAIAAPFRSRSDPPERLVIPSIGLDAKVVSIGVKAGPDGGLVWETAAFVVGHHEGTANPGDVGNVALSGHISSPNEGAVFRHLPKVKLGDGVVIATNRQHHLYRVTEIFITSPTAVENLGPTEKASATLVTCVPDGVYSHRLVVRAEAL